MLKLMYITNRPEIAKIAEYAGVDRIFIDMEYIGKSVRQGGMDTVQCHHTREDICAVKKVLNKSQIMVRLKKKLMRLLRQGQTLSCCLTLRLWTK